MANLTETSNFDPVILLLETTDSIQGGSGGNDNQPHQALANRTQYLKDETDANDAEILALEIDQDNQDGLISDLQAELAALLDRFEQGTVIYENKFVIEGMTLVKILGTRYLFFTLDGSGAGDLSTIVFFDSFRLAASSASMLALIPTNSSGDTIKYHVYFYESAPDVYNVGVAASLPVGALPLYEIDVPDGSTDGVLNGVFHGFNYEKLPGSRAVAFKSDNGSNGAPLGYSKGLVNTVSASIGDDDSDAVVMVPTNSSGSPVDYYAFFEIDGQPIVDIDTSIPADAVPLWQMTVPDGSTSEGGAEVLTDGGFELISTSSRYLYFGIDKGSYVSFEEPMYYKIGGAIYAVLPPAFDASVELPINDNPAPSVYYVFIHESNPGVIQIADQIPVGNAIQLYTVTIPANVSSYENDPRYGVNLPDGVELSGNSRYFRFTHSTQNLFLKDIADNQPDLYPVLFGDIWFYMTTNNTASPVDYWFSFNNASPTGRIEMHTVEPDADVYGGARPIMICKVTIPAYDLDNDLSNATITWLKDEGDQVVANGITIQDDRGFDVTDPLSSVTFTDLRSPADVLAGATITDVRKVQEFNEFTFADRREVTIPLANPIAAAPDYDVITTIESAEEIGLVGHIEVFDKQSDSFKMRITGSADNVTIRYTVVSVP